MNKVGDGIEVFIGGVSEQNEVASVQLYDREKSSLLISLYFTGVAQQRRVLTRFCSRLVRKVRYVSRAEKITDYAY